MLTSVARKATVQVRAATSRGTASTRSGGVGYRKYQGDALWLPNTSRPDWLDGNLPGDRGFDPLGLAKPAGYVQIGLDGQNQNSSKNEKGVPEGNVAVIVDEVSDSKLQPYSEVFGLQRFRECELIHGRWAMLACLGAIVAEASTGVSWAEAGKVELDGASYAGFELPFSITQLVWIEVFLVGGAEFYRSGELDSEKRIYPGGAFDPLNFAKGDIESLKLKEIKNGRLAMMACLGFVAQHAATGKTPLQALSEHISNPWSNNFATNGVSLPF